MTKTCAECQKEFAFKTHNQKYCSNECCRIATNKRIMEKYYQKRARLRGEERLCKCGSPLSRYNPEDICEMCFNLNRKNKKTVALEAIQSVVSNTKKTSSK